MSEIRDLFLCSECKKCREESKVIAEGRIENLFYITFAGDRNFFISTNQEDFRKTYPSLDKFRESLRVFGKFEIEDYVAKELMTAIFITKNLTNLFHTSLICENTRVDKERLADVLMGMLEVVKVEGFSTWLKLKNLYVI